MKLKFFLLSVFFIFLFGSVWSQPISDTAVKTLKSGNWSDPTVWTSNRIPDYRDSIVLLHNIVVDINATCKALNSNGKNISVNSGVKLNVEGFAPTINANARVVDSNFYKLKSTADELSAGVFKYQPVGNPPPFSAGNIIIDNTAEGYLRKVNTVQTSGGIITLSTEQATMEDVFQKAKFGYDLSTANLQPTVTGGASQLSDEGISFSLNPRNLVTAGPITIDLTKANLTLKPDMRFEYDFGFTGLNSLSILCNNANLKGEVAINVKASGATSGSRVDTLKRMGLTRTVLVYGIPVNMKIDFFLISTLSFSADAQIERTVTFNTDNFLKMGVVYSNNGGWTPTFEILSSSNKLDLGTSSGKARLTVGLDLKPLFKVRFYSIAGPFVFLDVRQKLTGRVQSPSLDWDFHYQAWAEPGLGVEAKIFGKKPTTFGPAKWSTDTLNYRTPFKIKKISGDLQSSGDTSKYLPDSIKIQILDELDFSQSNVVTHFQLNDGHGTISDTSVVMDQNGFAGIRWKIDTVKEQSITVSVKDGAGGQISNSPVVFHARYGVDTFRVLKVYDQSNTPIFTTNIFRAIAKGKDNALWAGTNGQGFYKLSDTSWSKWGAYTTVIAQQMQCDKTGGVWIAQSGYNGAQSTTGGLLYFPDSSFNNYTFYSVTQNGLPSRNARSIFVDTTRLNGNTGNPMVWVATWAQITGGVSSSGAIGRGINAVAPQFSKISTGIDGSLGSGGVWNVGGDSAEIWTYANNNFGKSQILRHNAQTNALVGAYDVTNGLTGFVTDQFQAKGIYFDKKGNRWITVNAAGVVSLDKNGSWKLMNDPSLLTASPLFNTNAVTGDSFGNVYFGTSNGLLKYIAGKPIDQASSYKLFTTANGLPSNSIQAIYFDDLSKTIYLGTSAGIAVCKEN